MATMWVFVSAFHVRTVVTSGRSRRRAPRVLLVEVDVAGRGVGAHPSCEQRAVLEPLLGEPVDRGLDDVCRRVWSGVERSQRGSVNRQGQVLPEVEERLPVAVRVGESGCRVTVLDRRATVLVDAFTPVVAQHLLAPGEEGRADPLPLAVGVDRQPEACGPDVVAGPADRLGRGSREVRPILDDEEGTPHLVAALRDVDDLGDRRALGVVAPHVTVGCVVHLEPGLARRVVDSEVDLLDLQAHSPPPVIFCHSRL